MQGLLAGAFGVGGGIYWFVQGFKELKASRTIENVPTSRIMTGAMGTNVEIKGKILSSTDRLLSAPISGQSCVFYSIEIQKLVRSKNNSYWKKIDQFFSSESFYVDDGSGAIAQAFVEGAEVQRRGRVEKFKIRSNNFESLPERLASTLKENEARLKAFKLKNTSWLFSQEYRFLEWSFQPEEAVYVLGFAESGAKSPERKKLKFTQFLQAKKMIEDDPQLQTRFDRNQDGVLDAGELERGGQMVGVALQPDPVPVQENVNGNKVKMIFKKRKGSAYIISNIRENDLVKKFSMKATLKVWGGPVVAILSAVYLIFIYSHQI